MTFYLALLPLAIAGLLATAIGWLFAVKESESAHSKEETQKQLSFSWKRSTSSVT